MTATESVELLHWMQKARLSRDWRDRRDLRASFSPALVEEVAELKDEQLDKLVERLFNHPFDSFEPRPDVEIEGNPGNPDDPEDPEDPGDVDQQTSFYESTALVTTALGGNGSGKTYVAAMRTIAWLFERQPPPKPNTPFWIIGPTLELTAQVAWEQKLSQLIPEEWVQWDKITWANQNRNFPKAVPLVPWARDKSKWWTLEFKSLDQGREAMQAAAIGGAWFTEQYPKEIFDEVFRGIREYGFPGSIIAEFTPIDPRYCAHIEATYNKWRAGDEETEDYAFYHLNTLIAARAGHANQKWAKNFDAAAGAEMRDTKIRGMFASYQGVIYKTFRPSIHLLDFEKEGIEIPPAVIHKRGVDWGSTEEHPFVVVWGYKDSLGTWWIYDEYWNNDQSLTWDDHAEAIIAKRPWDLTSAYYQQTYAPPDRPDLKREFSNRGIPITAASAGPHSVNQGIEVVRQLLKVQKNTGMPRLIIDKRRCPHLAAEMGVYRWLQSTENSLNPKAAQPKPLKKDDDSCFPAGTLIDTPAGPRAIETVRPGDEVTTHLGAAAVLAASATGLARVIRVTFDDEREIVCTPAHPLAVTGGGFCPAGDSMGVCVDVSTGGRPPATESPERSIPLRRQLARAGVRGSYVVSVEPQAGSVRVYNLSTADGTYFAGGVLVSNCDALRYLVFSDYTYPGPGIEAAYTPPPSRPQVRHNRGRSR